MWVWVSSRLWEDCVCPAIYVLRTLYHYHFHQHGVLVKVVRQRLPNRALCSLFNLNFATTSKMREHEQLLGISVHGSL